MFYEGLGRLFWLRLSTGGTGQEVELLLLVGGNAATEAHNQVDGGVLLNAKVAENSGILHLLAGEEQTLLVNRHVLLQSNSRLELSNRGSESNVDLDGLTSNGLNENVGHVEGLKG